MVPPSWSRVWRSSQIMLTYTPRRLMPMSRSNSMDSGPAAAKVLRLPLQNALSTDLLSGVLVRCPVILE